MTPLTQLGFAVSVTESSGTPQRDGYIATKNGLPYHVHPTETPVEWGILSAAIVTKEVTVTAYVPLVRSPEEYLADLRGQRDLLLAQSDWTQLSDTALTSDQRAEWAAYRKSLRDLPGICADPANPTWPQTPA